MQFVHNDGGRLAAGYKGDANDCVVRAIAIATGDDYRSVYDMIAVITGASPRKGVRNDHTRHIMHHLGWKWHPTMHIGQGCKVHLNPDELPSGTIVVKLSRHIATVIDGVLHDTYDCTRDGTRCVYGYWSR